MKNAISALNFTYRQNSRVRKVIWVGEHDGDVRFLTGSRNIGVSRMRNEKICNLAHIYSRIAEICIFYKSKMSDGRHFGNRKLALTPQPFIRQLRNFEFCVSTQFLTPNRAEYENFYILKIQDEIYRKLFKFATKTANIYVKNLQFYNSV